MKNIEQKIKNIQERNKAVETDKAWELSIFRKIIIAILTYFTVALFFLAGGFPKPFISASIPTLGFILSTLSLNFFKKLWLQYFYKKD